MQTLKNKVFVVTGAGSGIGRALALALDKKGAKLVLNDVNESALAETASQLSQTCVTSAFSVAERSEWISFKDKAIEAFGAVDGIINNAGIAHEAVAIQYLREEDLKLVMDINFYGVVNGTQVFLPHLATRSEAAIVNVSSIFGVAAVNLQSAYCASKFAVRGFTESLRMEALTYYPNLTVTVVHPGGIKTNIADTAITAGSRTDEERASDKQRFTKTFITSAEQAADTIIKGVEQKNTRILIGMDAKIMDTIVRLMPRAYSKHILKNMKKQGLITDELAKPIEARQD